MNPCSWIRCWPTNFDLITSKHMVILWIYYRCLIDATLPAISLCTTSSLPLNNRVPIEQLGVDKFWLNQRTIYCNFFFFQVSKTVMIQVTSLLSACSSDCSLRHAMACVWIVELFHIIFYLHPTNIFQFTFFSFQIFFILYTFHHKNCYINYSK